MRLEINKIDARIEELFRVSEPTQIIAEVRAVHSRNFIASYSDGLAATSLRSRLCKRCAAAARQRRCADSRLLLLAEFLEARIIAERIEHRIEPEQRRSERDVRSQCALVRDRE